MGIGRFGQVDPLDWKRWSCYTYSEDNPLSLVDPEGERAWSEERYGDGKICVDSSCHDSPAYKRIGETMKSVPDWGGNSNRLPNPPQPCPDKKRQQCAITDGLDIPPGTPITYDGAPQPPKGKRGLRIRDGWTCEFRCAASGITLKCWHVGIPPHFAPPFWP
jgi:hypothetical protein